MADNRQRAAMVTRDLALVADRLIHDHAAKIATAQNASMEEAVEAVWKASKRDSCGCQLRRALVDRALRCPRRSAGQRRRQPGNCSNATRRRGRGQWLCAAGDRLRSTPAVGARAPGRSTHNANFAPSASQSGEAFFLGPARRLPGSPKRPHERDRPRHRDRGLPWPWLGGEFGHEACPPGARRLSTAHHAGRGGRRGTADPTSEEEHEPSPQVLVDDERGHGARHARMASSAL